MWQLSKKQLRPQKLQKFLFPYYYYLFYKVFYMFEWDNESIKFQPGGNIRDK